MPSKEVVANIADVEMRKLHEIVDLLFIPLNVGHDEQQAWFRRALEQYESLAPRDGIEGMLAAQMIGTHAAALECLRRAAHSRERFADREQNLKHAQKLMALYTQQVAALNKHRGKGQQKVTVEHVHIEAGAQAIVGNVDSGAGKHNKASPAVLEEQKSVPMPEFEPSKLRRT
ncbi:hypothetical protein C8D95_103106 [Silicimonas algicola]|uniref:Uncharacterized protein n=2 Tax=Silicimonas algicola TaxID=1826607 RepID=A0A316G7H8_9RHOB|nr:hypothetical protein C8D95_103106 [Silicimonas algicola]